MLFWRLKSCTKHIAMCIFAPAHPFLPMCENLKSLNSRFCFAFFMCKKK